MIRLSPYKFLSISWKTCFIYYLVCVLNNYAFQSESLIAQGTVLRIKKQTVVIEPSTHVPGGKSKHVIKYKPLMTFISKQGKLIEFTSDVNCSSCKPGDTMDIMYLPDNPLKARIKYKRFWMPSIKYAVYGVIFLIMVGMVRILLWFVKIVRQDRAKSSNYRGG